ncbi:MAG: hypothetical protein ACRDL0_14625 [Thermoleophilaceae bacterium]
MTAQDDVREREMRTLFNLVRPEEYGRADVDAVLELRGRGVPEDLRGRQVPFELKSATAGRPTFSTVRDFGLHYIEKWRQLHWLFGIYGRDRRGDQVLQYCLYGSPAAMAPWFDRMAAYTAPDVSLAEHVPDLITDDTLTAILGDAEQFSRDDARRLMKNQYGAADYDAAADLAGGQYSRVVMLQMLRERCEYVIRRGSTLNNPHIPASYFAGWEQITQDHAARLRELVVEALLDA